MPETKYEYFQKRKSEDGSVELLGFFTYERSSVLAGQTGKRYLCSGDTEEQLQDVATREGYDVVIADLNWFSKFLFQEASVPLNPPPDFDHYDAGEYWGEDDY